MPMGTGTMGATQSLSLVLSLATTHLLWLVAHKGNSVAPAAVASHGMPVTTPSMLSLLETEKLIPSSLPVLLAFGHLLLVIFFFFNEAEGCRS